MVKLRMAVKREFQNANGEYDTDFINIYVWEFLAEHAANYIKKGTRLGVKGRVCPKVETVGEIKVQTIELYADRLIFLGETGMKEFDVNDYKPKGE